VLLGALQAVFVTNCSVKKQLAKCNIFQHTKAKICDTCCVFATFFVKTMQVFRANLREILQKYIKEVYTMNKWDKRFMELTYAVAEWSSCYKANRHVGAIIVKDNRILTTGYNGAPQGVQTCRDKGECMREKLGIASGTRHELCYAVHAEQNAILQAARLGISLKGATLYCTHQPCVICAKMIINSGITRIVYKEGYPDEFSMQLLNQAGVQVDAYDKL